MWSLARLQSAKAEEASRSPLQKVREVFTYRYWHLSFREMFGTKQCCYQSLYMLSLFLVVNNCWTELRELDFTGTLHGCCNVFSDFSYSLFDVVMSLIIEALELALHYCLIWDKIVD